MSAPTPTPDFTKPDHDTLPIEHLVELTTNTGISARIACTPENLIEFATGWLYTQHLISGIDNIVSIQICDQHDRILIQVKPNDAPTSRAYAPVMTSGCAGGVIDHALYRSELSVCQSPCTIGLGQIRESLHVMFEWLRSRPTRGLHCAALVPLTGGQTLLTDDIGRHNAVDKVIGMALQSKCEFGEHLLATSGRISSDMLLKAAHANIPIIATARSATSLAAQLAEDTGITVVCRFGQAEPLILGNVSRVRN